MSNALLFQIHNVHHYVQFMAAIRSHIRAGSFAPFKAAFTERHAPARFRAAEAEAAAGEVAGEAGVGVGGTEDAPGSAAKRRRVGGAKSEAKE